MLMPIFLKQNRIGSFTDYFKYSTIMTPLLWVYGIGTITLVPAIVFSSDVVVRYCFLGLAIFLNVTVVGVYLFWCFKNPDRLHTEEHIRSMKEIDFAQSGKGELLVIEATTLHKSQKRIQANPSELSETL
ncbi:MAG: hypothetical protein QM537_03495 [Candidatus Symbiobacter sp.]|nr:hypothetical protein [Candidatus Symbiobacter sp.]